MIILRLIRVVFLVLGITILGIFTLPVLISGFHQPYNFWFHSILQVFKRELREIEAMIEEKEKKDGK